MNPLKLIFTSALLASLILGLFFFPEIKESVTHSEKRMQQQENDLAEAAQLLDLDRALEASSLIKKYKGEIETGSPQGKKWLDLLVRASEKLPDTAQLLLVFEYYPPAFKGHEKGALKVASALTAEGDWKNYQTLRELFKGTEAYPSEWFILDSDSLVLQGKNNEAIELLKSRYYEGAEDTPRLLRLALIHINEHPKLAWDFLDQALKKDPNNKDLRLYRARLLETAGKQDLAQSEYAAAGGTSESPSWIQGELADFYLRQHNYEKAIGLIEKQLGPSVKDAFALKALFLSRVIEPIPFDFRGIEASGSQKELISFIASLPEGQFWNAEAFNLLPQSRRLLETEQSTLWLRVLENLRTNRESDALSLLENNPFQTQLWDKDLAEALQRVLYYRSKGSLRLPADDNANSPSAVVSLPLLFDELRNYAQSENREELPSPSSDWVQLVKGPDALSTLFLARGWNEAAIGLMASQVFPDNTPEWVTPAMTLALRENRGLKEALLFAKLQRQNAPLRLVTAELLIEKGEVKEAEEELHTLAKLNSTVGRKSTRILAYLLFQKGDYSGAKEILGFQPNVQTSHKGQELLAKIALAEGHDDEAARYYAGIESTSLEAKSFLAKKAFDEKDYRKAYRLTEELLKSNPDSPVLKDNLNLLLKELAPKS